MRTLPYILMLLTITLSCQRYVKKKDTVYSFIYYDDLGRKISLTHTPKRILSLAPSMTEMLFAVCDTSYIIGVTEHCNYPEAAVHKEKIHTYPLDVEHIFTLKPDIIFTKDGMISLDHIQKIEEMGIPLYIQSYKTVNDIFNGLLKIGKIIGEEKKSIILVDSLKKELEKIKINTTSKKKITVLAITWYDPIYAYGYSSLFTDKLHLLGVDNAVDSSISSPYPVLSREYILKINPDIIIGKSFDTMNSSFFILYPELKSIKAYKNNHIYAITDDLHSRPSPRIIESMIELKNIINFTIANKTL